MLNKTLPTIEDQWDELLRFQANITLPVELPCYYVEKGWLEARSVVDLGTGNGYYLKRLQEHFPAKKYLGLDVDAEALEAYARAQAVSNRVPGAHYAGVLHLARGNRADAKLALQRGWVATQDVRLGVALTVCHALLGETEAARKQLLKLFDAWGATDPLTVETRRRLSSILFS